VAYYYQGSTTRNTSAEILAIGNPLIFWGSIVAFIYLAVVWIRRRDWRAGFILVAFLAQYVPWLFAARTLFLFYMAPMTPLMVLAVAYVLRDLSEATVGMELARALAPVAALVVLAAVGMFVYFLPVLTGRTISYGAWHIRMWFEQCSPKPGWCWI